MKTLILSLLLSSGVVFKDGFEPAPVQCSADIYPQGLRRSNGAYKTFNDGFDFGQSTNTSFLLNIRTYEFYALSGFSFDETEARRRIVFDNAPSSHHLFSVGTVSVSKCAGDFTESAECVIPVHNTSTLIITTKADDVSRGAMCKIEAGVKYYINYVLTDKPGTETPKCANEAHSQCAMFYTETEL